MILLDLFWKGRGFQRGSRDDGANGRSRPDFS